MHVFIFLNYFLVVFSCFGLVIIITIQLTIINPPITYMSNLRRYDYNIANSEIHGYKKFRIFAGQSIFVEAVSHAVM